MIATGGTALRSMALAVGAKGGDQLVMDDLHHHLAGGDRLDHGGADRLLADLFGKAPDHVERDVGFEQRAAHLAHRRIDVGLRQRPAPRQPIENATKLFRQIVEHVMLSLACYRRCVTLLPSYPAKAGYPVRRSFSAQASCSGILDHPLSRVMTIYLCLAVRLSNAPRRPSKHFCARGRIALSGVDLRPQGPGGGSKRKSFREVRRVKPPRARKVKESRGQMAFS